MTSTQTLVPAIEQTSTVGNVQQITMTVDYTEQGAVSLALIAFFILWVIWSLNFTRPEDQPARQPCGRSAASQ